MFLNFNKSWCDFRTLPQFHVCVRNSHFLLLNPFTDQLPGYISVVYIAYFFLWSNTTTKGIKKEMINTDRIPTQTIDQPTTCADFKKRTKQKQKRNMLVLSNYTSKLSVCSA